MSTKVRVTKRFEFEAAHFIPNHPACGEMHGHSFTVDVCVVGFVQGDGMIIDFGDLKAIVKPRLKELFDHKIINDVLYTPTAENIASYLFEYVDTHLPSHCRVHSIRVNETKNNSAECVADN